MKQPTITWDSLCGVPVRMETQQVDPHLLHVTLCAELPEGGRQDDWQVRIRLEELPTFFWAPHLAPKPGYCIDQHVFRCPALIASGDGWMTAVLPDLEVLKAARNRWYMDLDAPQRLFTLGVSDSELAEHVLYRKTPGQAFANGQFRFAFWLYSSTEQEDLADPFRPVLRFFWQQEGERLFAAGQPAHGPLMRYCEHTYSWAFDRWKDVVWQEFRIGDTPVGAPAFIVNATQSPGYPGPAGWRECLSVWNQAWFNSLRSASGLYRYARLTGNEEWLQKAQLTKELALRLPQSPDGLSYSVAATRMREKTVDGHTVSETDGWDSLYFGNSNRNPLTTDIASSPFHVLDQSVTATYMLRWYRDLEQDDRLLAYARRYAETLLRLQAESGFFPAFLTADGRILDELRESPETAASATFLLELYGQTGENRYLSAAIRAIEAVWQSVVPEGRWEDFETYWSCSRFGGDHVGQKFPRNDLYKQCNFSMFWTAEALFAAYTATRDDRYLQRGRRVLDELLMTQAVWQPPYMQVPVFGGFGVMNGDGEWLDARQSLFAGLILDYGAALQDEEYIQRGIAALRASFVMMYCPENPQVKREWENRWPHFGERDYGFMMENYGHDGRVDEAHSGMGEFTIYDWGNGAASEAYLRIREAHGDLLRRFGE